jgi:hypothetical protein
MDRGLYGVTAVTTDSTSGVKADAPLLAKSAGARIEAPGGIAAVNLFADAVHQACPTLR